MRISEWSSDVCASDLHVKDGGSTFRARFGLERNGETLLAEGSYTAGSELTDGYPEFTMGVLKKPGWDKDLGPEELEVIQKIGRSEEGRVGIGVRTGSSWWAPYHEKKKNKTKKQ